MHLFKKYKTDLKKKPYMSYNLSISIFSNELKRDN